MLWRKTTSSKASTNFHAPCPEISKKKKKKNFQLCQETGSNDGKLNKEISNHSINADPDYPDIGVMEYWLKIIIVSMFKIDKKL